MLRWPTSARQALTYLFQPLQDIDVYVEDQGDEVFYTELFQKITPSSVKLARIFAAGDRTAVIEAARRHDFSTRPALFVIDGDFEWVRGDDSPALSGLHRLPAYCIENLLIHEDAAIQMIVEEAAITTESAKERFAYREWIAGLEGALTDLFVLFAVLNLIEPEHPTVGLGIGKLLTASSGCLPELDTEKVDILRAQIREKIFDSLGDVEGTLLYSRIADRVKALPRSIDAISGKDFLLPLFEFRLWKCIEGKTKRRALRVRLARHCDRTLFGETTKAIQRAARGTVLTERA